MLEKLFDFSLLGEDFKTAINSVALGKKCSIFGLGLTEKAIVGINVTGKCIYITSDFLSAQKYYEIFSELKPKRTFLFEPMVDNLTYKKSVSKENNVSRIKTLYALQNNDADIVVASIDSILQYVPSVKDFNQVKQSLKVGDCIDLNLFLNNLVKMGYKQEAIVAEPATFSSRGDIIDVYPVNSKCAYRIELFDIQIESIKQINAETNRSEANVNELDICPNTNVFVNQNLKENIIKNLNALKDKPFDNIDAQTRFESICSELIFKLEGGFSDFTLDYLYPLIKDNLGCLFDYLSNDFVVVIDECKMVFDKMLEFEHNYLKRKKELLSTGEVLNVKNNGILNSDFILNRIKQFKCMAHQKITSANKFFNPDLVFTLKTSPMVKYSHNLNEFVNAVTGWLLDNYKVLICAGDDRNARKLKKMLSANNIELEINRFAGFGVNGSAILPFELVSGFSEQSNKVVVVGTYDIFAKKSVVKDVSLGKNVFTVPKVGDYVVHSLHGIGICEGITKLSGNLGTKDYIVVRYRDNDKLYVPIDQLDLLERFSGADVPSRLSKIGGIEFGAVKEKVKTNIKKMAIDLLRLYAERENLNGFAFVKDDELQLEFENSFAYTETEDQLNAIAEIKKDMQSNKVMDRLLCGDVGFGKTEVALRAMFKAVLSGKQVAFMAPTTILSEQHYNTCVARFKPFGVNVAVLNRFKSAKEINQTLQDLKNGKINVVCGTKRLISNDVQFANLGLIVLDEEQKFGVEDKEKLKTKYKNVDVLTLSATPIPRTLNMSLTGVRDISVISTPPSIRVPIQTMVLEYSDAIIKDAIIKEIARGGQVYIVYNRVETIYMFAKRIKDLLPDLRILVGHGQMKGNELEDVIHNFYNGLGDVLIATTIIENGVDMQNANTLIVIDADRFGLSQLYQIRGRVGRGSRQAYAYFMFKKDKTLTAEGYKRLEALSEFTEFGSGFKLAMRDLEIRGGGNIFGAEQHGHIQKIGYEMYCRILKNVIEELRGEQTENIKEVLIKVNANAYLPEEYITSLDARMKIYNKIARIESKQECDQIILELEDIYGKVPNEAINLIEVAYIKLLAKNIGVSEVYASTNEVRIVFGFEPSFVKSEQVANAIYKFSSKCVLNLGDLPTITIKDTNNEDSLNVLKNFLIISNQNLKK